MNVELKNKIKISLEKLLQRENEDSFVIIEDVKTGKFVQFAGGKYEELLFDIPQQILSKEEKERADKILNDHNIFYESHPVYDDNNSELEVGKQYGFSKKLNNDINLAVELVEKVMKKVYLIENVSIEFTEN
jgi:hypothetical protein